VSEEGVCGDSDELWGTQEHEFCLTVQHLLTSLRRMLQFGRQGPQRSALNAVILCKTMKEICFLFPHSNFFSNKFYAIFVSSYVASLR
jgi:hypothetical protein